jgi:hypothetical protein
LFSTSTSSNKVFVVAGLVLPLIASCGKKTATSANTEQAQQQAAPAQPVSSPDEPPAPSNGMALPTSFGRHTGDLDEMVKNRNIRALVILNPISFFYDKGKKHCSASFVISFHSGG